MASGTTQKIVLTALGGSVATTPDGLTADVVVVNNFDELKALPTGAVKGKILLFNERFDKRLAAQAAAGIPRDLAREVRRTYRAISASHFHCSKYDTVGIAGFAYEA
jgi:hypothetical protein